MEETTLLTNHNTYVCAEIESDPPLVVANRPEAGPWEQFLPEEVEPGRVGLKARNGKYVCVELDGTVVANRDVLGAWETFTLSYHDDGTEVALLGNHGYYLRAVDTGELRADAAQVGAWEKFNAPGLLPPAVVEPPPGTIELPLPPTAVAQLRGRMARAGVSLLDASGARSYTACHFFEAFSAYTRDPARTTAQLAAIAQAYPAIRFLDVVGWYPYWRGREVSPIAFTARDGYAVPATPEYWSQLIAFAQVLQRLGLKAHWTRGDLQLFGGRAGIEDHIRRVCQAVRVNGLQDVIEVHEVVNEPVFNGVGLTDARHLGGVIRAELPGTLMSHGAPGDSEEATDIRAWAQGADVGTVHGLRPGNPTDVLRHIFSVRREGFAPGTCALQGEPFGPGTDVSGGRSDDVELLTLACAQSLITAQRWTYMSGYGVRWNGAIHGQPGFTEVATLAGWIPEDVFGWKLTRGGLADNPFASASGYFGDTGVSHGPSRVDAAVAPDGRYLVTVYGGRPAYVLRAQHRLSFDVINTATRQVEQTGTLEPGQTLQLHEYRIGRLVAGKLL